MPRRAAHNEKRSAKAKKARKAGNDALVSINAAGWDNVGTKFRQWKAFRSAMLALVCCAFCGYTAFNSGSSAGFVTVEPLAAIAPYAMANTMVEDYVHTTDAAGEPAWWCCRHAVLW